ncbi:DNA helicase [Trifolium repens]|nr:DNA helicase [Trifolium repens]
MDLTNIPSSSRRPRSYGSYCFDDPQSSSSIHSYVRGMVHATGAHELHMLSYSGGSGPANMHCNSTHMVCSTNAEDLDIPSNVDEFDVDISIESDAEFDDDDAGNPTINPTMRTSNNIPGFTQYSNIGQPSSRCPSCGALMCQGDIEIVPCGRIDSTLNDGNGPPVYVINGENYHHIGSLLPMPGESPKFAQLYIYDTDNEISNRMASVGMEDDHESIRSSIVKDIREALDTCNNSYVQAYNVARNAIHSQGATNIRMKILGKRGRDGRRLKLKSLINDIKNGYLFGKVKAVVYTIEFQKRAKTEAHSTHSRFAADR